MVPDGTDKNVLPDITNKLRAQTSASDGNIDISQGKNFGWANLETQPSVL